MINIDPGPIRRRGNKPHGAPYLDGTWWTQPSSLAKALDDGEGLIGWTARMTVLGMARSADLIALASTLKPEQYADLNNVVDQALTRAKHQASATLGTAIHSATQAHDEGQDTDHLPQDLRDAVGRYQSLLDDHQLTPVAAEVFVVNRALGCAGTLDRIYAGPNRVVVGDIKTSKSTAPRYSAVAWAIQVATYAGSEPVVDGQIVTWEDAGLPRPSQDHAVIVHLPNDKPESPQILVADLKQGRALAELAKAVREHRKWTPVSTLAQAQ